MNSATTSIKKEFKNDFEQVCAKLSINFEESFGSSRPGCIEYRLGVTDMQTFFELGLQLQEMACARTNGNQISQKEPL